MLPNLSGTEFSVKLEFSVGLYRFAEGRESRRAVKNIQPHLIFSLTDFSA